LDALEQAAQSGCGADDVVLEVGAVDALVDRMPSMMISARAGTIRLTVSAFTTSSGSPRKAPAISSSEPTPACLLTAARFNAG